MILIDSNILIDIIEDDPVWADWSEAALNHAQQRGAVAFNAVVTAEVAPRFGSLDAFLTQMDDLVIQSENITDQGAYLAGKAFQSYRTRRGEGAARSVLPDFLIGGHAQAVGAEILTRDPRFYRIYFPKLTLITPESHP